MYTVIVFGAIETWEKSFSDYYGAFAYAQENKAKGFEVEVLEF